jgi:hypothetical protein
VVGNDGGVYSTYVDGNDYQWPPRFRVSNAMTTPGAAVSALVARPGHVDLFVAGPDSGDYSTSHEAGAVAGSAPPSPNVDVGVLTTKSAPSSNVVVGALAAKGEATVNQDPLSAELRRRLPEGPARRASTSVWRPRRGRPRRDPGRTGFATR